MTDKSGSVAQFYLDDGFVERYTGKQPKWGPVGYVTYKRTYARSVDKDSDGLLSIPQRIYDLAQVHGLRGTEEWWLTVTRVVEGTFEILRSHCESLRLPWDAKKAQTMAQEMYRLIWEFKFSPPGRGLWMMGTEAVKSKGGAALNNCAFVSTDQIATDFAAPFCFLMDMSMLGVGVGGDTRGAGQVQILDPKWSSDTLVIEDSREGWVDALRRVLNAFIGRDTLPGNFDFSKIRPKGAIIRTFGGTASGPAPLSELLSTVIELLGKRVGKRIRSCDIVDIFNLIGRCVVAGNVRRSAEIMFGEPTDSSFLELKDPDKNAVALASHRWASNNSTWAEVGMDYSAPAAKTAKNGEPGYMWLESAQKWGRMIDPPDYKDRRAAGGNPCLEQTLESFELCCLVESYPAHHKTLDEYKKTLKMAYLYAKAVTLVPTHDQRTNAVLLRNRRIGTSMSGIVQSIQRHGLREHFRWCDVGYKHLGQLDDEYSGWLCVPTSIKKTSVKPSGTVSLLCGATPGVHFPKGEFYFRVIRMDKDSPIVSRLRSAGYRCEDIDQANEPNTTACYFAVKEPYFQRSIKDVSMWEQLEIAAQMQAYWADNQVSVTIEFDKETEGPQIKHALQLYETRLKGVSFLPKSLDGTGYLHPPYQPIDERTYRDYVGQLSPYDLSNLGNEVQDKFCDSDKCEIPQRKAS